MKLKYKLIIILVLFILLICFIGSFIYTKGRLKELNFINDNFDCYEKESFKDIIADEFGFEENQNNSNLSLFRTMNTNIPSSLIISEPTEFIAMFSPNYHNVTINGEICSEVPCPCDFPEGLACLNICYYCEETSEKVENQNSCKEEK